MIYQHIVQNTMPVSPKRFLAIGDWSPVLDKLLREGGWSGVHADYNGMAAVRAHDNLESIFCEVGPDNHFLRLLDGYWVKCCTVEEIFNQFSGPYDLIWLDITEKNRMLWYTRQIQDSRPTFYVLPEDNHNENVSKVGKDRGYWGAVVEDRLILCHPTARTQK